MHAAAERQHLEPPKTTNLGVRSSNLFGRTRFVIYFRMLWRLIEGHRDFAGGCPQYVHKTVGLHIICATSV